MKDIKISHLQRKTDHWLHEAHKNPTNENWRNIGDVRNEIKRKNSVLGEDFMLEKQ